MPEIDEQALMNRFKVTTATGVESYAAARQIQLWKASGQVTGDQDTLVRLYMAVKALHLDLSYYIAKHLTFVALGRVDQGLG